MVKNLLRKSKDPYLALLASRSTPLEIGYNPSQLLMSRRLHSTVPMVRSLREPQVPDKSSVSAKNNQIKSTQKENFDNRHRVQDTETLSIGDQVWLPDQETEGQVVTRNTPHSYIVQTPQGQYRRNRIQVNPLPLQGNVSEQIHQDNGTADMSTVDNLPN